MKRNGALWAAACVVALAALPQTREFAWPFVATVLAVNQSSAPTVNELTLKETIPLGNVKGRIDHMAIDMKRRRLFIAELGNDSVAVVDVVGRKVAARITGLKEPLGLAYAAKADRLFIANGGDGSIGVREGSELKPAGKIELGDDADNIRLDGPDRVIVGYGSALAVLASATGEKIADFHLAAHPEAFMPEPDGARIFVNEPNAVRTDLAPEECLPRSMMYDHGNGSKMDEEIADGLHA
jgi:YVTN family beta-propeller protein